MQRLQNSTVEIIERVEQVARKAGFNVYERAYKNRFCFDLAIKKEELLMFIKVLSNIDCLAESHADALKRIAFIFSASAVLVGEKTRKGKIEEDTVYIRYGIPAVNVDTLENILLHNILPLVYAKRGGYYVKIDGEKLRKIREELQLSLGNLAEKIGVSRRAIYEYERNTMDATLDTVIQIEKLLDVPISRPISLFDWPFEDLKLSDNDVPNDPISSLIYHSFRKLGFRTVFTSYAPFDALSFEGLDKQFKLVTGIEKRSKDNIREKIAELNEFAKVTEKSAFLIAKNEKYVNSEDLVVLTIKDIKRLKSKKELFQKLRND